MTKKYYSTNSKDRKYNNSLREASKAIDQITPINRTSANSQFREYRDILPNTSIRDGFSKYDYDYFNKEDAIPKSKNSILAICTAAYYRVGLIRNIIDLMGDVASQGIRIVHPNKTTEKFYQAWFKKVGGKERSERFLNLLYRNGNVIVKRASKKIKDQEQFIKELRSQASINSPSNEMPWQYFFLDPLSIERESAVLSTFCNTPLFSMKIPTQLRKIIMEPSNEYERDLVKEIPQDIKNAIKSKKNDSNSSIRIILDPSKVRSFYYKKDDWMPWAHPMIYAILDDLILLEKMKLADLTALDGAVSHIRLWTLGDLEHDIFPTEEAVRKLTDLLINTAGNGSVLDLIWGPGLKLTETNSNIYQFLGGEKYTNVLSNIYGGLGIPQMLTGSSSKGGMSTDFMQIKTLVKRLEYGREQLMVFWLGEIEIIRRVMSGRKGFSSKKMPDIIFDHMSLTDEAAQTKLILDMLDREIISIKTAREDLGYIHSLEESRLDEEIETRAKKPKVSPYHASQPDHDYKKLFIQRGVMTPSQVGLELPDPKPSEKFILEDKSQPKNTLPSNKKKGTPGEGRPKNATDTQPRKRRTPLVANLFWVQSAYDDISSFVFDVLSVKFNKANLRKFTNEEYKMFEDLKFGVLCNVEPFSKITEDILIKAISKPFIKYGKAKTIYQNIFNEFVSTYNQEPTIDQRKQICCLAYLEIIE